MTFQFRECRLQDTWRRTQGESPVPQLVLNLKSWECVQDSQVVGHCTANSATGEVVGLSVEYGLRRQGIARTLLAHIVRCLRGNGAARIWVTAPGDCTSPAYHFYRSLGWRPTGEPQAHGDEILELPNESVQ